LLVGRTAGHDIGGLHHPDADAFVATRVDVAGVVDGHFGIGRPQAAHVLVGEPVLAANENFPKGPGRTAHDDGFLGVNGSCAASGAGRLNGRAGQAAWRAACFSAWAASASRTQAPFSWAWTRVRMRSRLH